MRPQPRIYRRTQLPAFRVIINPFRVQETCHAFLCPQTPGLRQEAFIQVGLHPAQYRVVLLRIQEVLHPFTAFIFAAPGRFQRRDLVKGINTQRCQLRGAQLTQHKFRLVITQHTRFLPFHFQPRRVSEHQVKTAALGKQVAELQIPVEETVLLSQGIDNRQTRQMTEQHLSFQTTCAGKQ